MFLIYSFREACQNLRTHSSRIFSMGFGVAWAIFILILLFGISSGVSHKTKQEIAKFGETTMKIASYKKESWIPLSMVEPFSKQFDSIKAISPMVYVSNAEGVYYKGKGVKEFFSCAVGYNYASIDNLTFAEGRFFTARDPYNCCVIGPFLKEQLFGKASAIGQYILLGSTLVQVIGVLADSNYHPSKWILFPVYLVQKTMKEINRCDIELVLQPTADAAVAEAQFRNYLARQLHVDPKDEEAIVIYNMAKYAKKILDFFRSLDVFIWIIGICFLITGMVAVANMMIVTIYERTQEIAIRRVVGGSSVTIMAMVVWEVMLITCCSGVVGSTVGFGLIQLMNKWIIPLFSTYMSNLTCSFAFAWVTLVLLLVASCLASIVPAIRAVAIKPVAALGDK